MASGLRLLRGPIVPRPPELFDARRLLQVLRPHVGGPRCTGENICGHRRSYLEAS